MGKVRFSISLGLSLLASVLVFAGHAQADIYYNPATGRMDIGMGMTGSSYFENNFSLGLSFLPSAQLFTEQAQANVDYDPAIGGFYFFSAVAGFDPAPAPPPSQPFVIDLGRASLFTVLASGKNEMSGLATIYGNVGIGDHGEFKMSGGQIHGNLYVRTTAKYKLSGSAHIDGMIFQDPPHNSSIDNAIADAQNLTDAAWGLMATHNYTVNGFRMDLQDVNIKNQSLTLAPWPTMDSTPIVLHLTNFVMNGGTFSLTGTAATMYIIDISGKFSLSGNAQILLSGVLPSHVLFNIYGTGSMVSISGSSLMNGILLAMRRSVTVSGTGRINGRLFADEVNLNTGAQVISQ